ncbi:MAG: sugar phosphate isomerase/epimerase family protein [Promethearchaeota archaeon]
MKYILHSVSYAGFWKGQAFLPLEAFLEKASTLGFDGVELMAKRPHASLLDLDGGRRAKIRDQLDSLGLECACIAGYTDFTLGAKGCMIPLLEMQVKYVSDLVDLARDVGASLIRVFTGNEVEGVPYADQWDSCVQGLKECAQVAGKAGITIGIQNHHDIAVDATSLSHLVAEIDEPNCKVMFDAWAPSLQGIDLVESLKTIASDLVYTTVADYIRIPRFIYHPTLVNYSREIDRTVAVPMGEGFIDYETFFEALKDMGFDGPVAYEMCSKLRDGGTEQALDDYARKVIKFMET